MLGLTILPTLVFAQDLHALRITFVASTTLVRVSHTALQSYANLNNVQRFLISQRTRDWWYARWITDAARLLLNAPRRREHRKANAAMLKLRSKTRPSSRRGKIDTAGAYLVLDVWKGREKLTKTWTAAYLFESGFQRAFFVNTRMRC